MNSFKTSFSRFALLSAVLFSITTHAAPVQDNTNRIVVMISVDGLAGHYMDDPKAEMPNIRALAKAGARASSMVASTPTVTWPNHTTLVTGVNPSRHGVVGNNYYDRAKKQKVTLILDPVYDKEEIVKVPTIYDVAKASGLHTAATTWPATRNAKSLDWTMPEVGTAALFEKYTTPGLLEEFKKDGIFLSEQIFGSSKEEQSDEAADAISTRSFNLILKNHRPHLALLHLRNVDHVQHAKGPKSKEAYAAIKAADAEVGNVWQELKAGFPNKATLLIVSDHGFSPINNVILPNIILRDAGLVKVEGKKIIGGSVQTVVQGGSIMLYVLDEKNRSDVIKQIEKAFRDVKGISKIVRPEQLNDYGMANPKDDPNAPDMILFAKEGYTFGDTAAGALSFQEKPERFGSHGHEASLPDLHATFVAWGAGIKTGARVGEIKNIDVAPTIARLLNLSFTNVDGKPLSGILK